MGGSDSERWVWGDDDEPGVGYEVVKDGGLSVSVETSEVGGISMGITGVD